MTTLRDVSEILAKATPGPWESVTEGSYDQRHAAAKAFLAVMETRARDNADIEYSDMTWVRAGFPNVAMVGNGPNGPENGKAIALAVNLAPALIAVAEAARAWRDRPYASNSDPEWVAVVEALAALDVALGRTP